MTSGIFRFADLEQYCCVFLIFHVYFPALCRKINVKITKTQQYSGFRLLRLPIALANSKESSRSNCNRTLAATLRRAGSLLREIVLLCAESVCHYYGVFWDLSIIFRQSAGKSTWKTQICPFLLLLQGQPPYSPSLLDFCLSFSLFLFVSSLFLSLSLSLSLLRPPLTFLLLFPYLVSCLTPSVM